MSAAHTTARQIERAAAETVRDPHGVLSASARLATIGGQFIADHDRYLAERDARQAEWQAKVDAAARVRWAREDGL